MRPVLCDTAQVRRTLVVTLLFVVLHVLFAASPEHIVITRVFPGPGQLELAIANADGTGEHPLLPDRNMDYDPAWSPDGASIVFTSERNGSADLYRVKPDGTGLERLTDIPAYDDQAAFSPDGKQLVFVTHARRRHGRPVDDGSADAAREGADVGRRRRLPAVVVARRPMDCVLVRSRRATAVRARAMGSICSSSDIYLIHPDGTGLKRLTPHGDFCGSPKWAADSRA